MVFVNEYLNFQKPALSNYLCYADKEKYNICFSDYHQDQFHILYRIHPILRSPWPSRLVWYLLLSILAFPSIKNESLESNTF